MIRFIRGTVAECTEQFIILENNGMGFRIYMPLSAIAEEIRVGDELKVHTYMSVREDAMQLYGFLTGDDLKLFELLIGVNGIGPKGALSVLSLMRPDEIRFAVLSDDAAAIAKAPGIGKKTAQKVILELKDKLKLEDAFEERTERLHPASAAGASSSDLQDAVMALTALGYPNTEALRAVKAVENASSLDAEGLLKAALKHLI